mgnify:CR=1 FL=1
MEECIFCRISKKEIPKELFFESDQVIAFKDIKPSTPVHFLIIPRQHITSIAQLEPSHAQVLAQLLYAAKELGAQAGLKGYKLVFNVGREGGQVIDHLHLHLLGGWTNKGESEAMPHPKLDR